MKWRYLILPVFVLVLFGALFLISKLQKTIIIVINGEKRIINTPALTVGGALNLAEISVSEGDEISQDINQLLHDGDMITVERASQVHIMADGESYIFKSADRSLYNLLTELDIPLHANDRIVVNGLPYYPEILLSYLPTQSIQIIRSRPISILLNSERFKIRTNTASLGQALWENGIKLYKKDKLEPAVYSPLEQLQEAIVRPSQVIEIKTLDRSIIERTSAHTVGEALNDAGFPLQGLDYSIPAEDASVPFDGEIKVVKVREEVIVKTSPIPFETQYQPSPDLLIDNQQIIQPGEIGLMAQRIRVRYENDEEMERITESEYIAKQPSKRIIGYGKKLEPQTITTPGGPVNYWRALDMYAVSYNPTSAGGTITASGLPLQKGVAAVDPEYIPYGTRLYIPGYGEAIAADTGPGITPRIIDLGYSDNDYVSWHQPVTVYFIWPPPENITWIIP